VKWPTCEQYNELVMNKKRRILTESKCNFVQHDTFYRLKNQLLNVASLCSAKK
jgi:hypothetical protein